MNRSIVVAVVLTALSSGAMAAKHRFDIDRGKVQVTLNEWSRQSGEQILFDFHAVYGMTKPLHGVYEDATALRLLLGSLPYTGDPVNAKTWAVVRIPRCKPWLADLAPPPPCINPQMVAQL